MYIHRGIRQDLTVNAMASPPNVPLLIESFPALGMLMYVGEVNGGV